MNNKKKYLSNVQIKNFRLAEDVKFNPSSYLNILLGKNGTAKSTVLGMIGQGFSFNPKLLSKDNLSKTEYLKLSRKKNKNEKEETLIKNYEALITYTNKNFETKVNEHFKLSQADTTGSVHATMTLKYSGNNVDDEIFSIESNNYSDRTNPRLVTRRTNKQTSDDVDDSSSNLIFPVIYLGLNRVMPIVQSGNLHAVDLGLNDSDTNRIFDLYESILLKSYDKNFEGISNNSKKNTAAFIPANRSLEMISSGEDNIGQILLSLFSFKKLQETYPDYNGGILLIDEIDVTLYPAAQLKLIDIIYKLALEFKIQVFCTTHSIELIDHVMRMKLQNTKNNFIKLFNFKLNKDNHLVAKEALNINEIKNEFFALSNQKKVEDKIPVYFEDKEAIYVFNQIITSKKIKQFLSIQNTFTLGCSELIKLNQLKIAEFSTDSIVCLDGDTKHTAKNYLSLPTIDKFPPEQFIYTIISTYKTEFWKTTTSYEESILINNPYNEEVRAIVNGYSSNEQRVYGTDGYGKKDRNIWKDWFKEEKKNWNSKNNPIKFWMNHDDSKDSLLQFYKNLKASMLFVAKNRGIDLNIAIEEIDKLIKNISK